MTGRFEMGSTIVLIWETKVATQSIFVKEGQKVKLGQKLVTTEISN